MLATSAKAPAVTPTLRCFVCLNFFPTQSTLEDHVFSCAAKYNTKFPSKSSGPIPSSSDKSAGKTVVPQLNVSATAEPDDQKQSSVWFSPRSLEDRRKQRKTQENAGTDNQRKWTSAAMEQIHTLEEFTRSASLTNCGSTMADRREEFERTHSYNGTFHPFPSARSKSCCRDATTSGTTSHAVDSGKKSTDENAKHCPLSFSYNNNRSKSEGNCMNQNDKYMPEMSISHATTESEDEITGGDVAEAVCTPSPREVCRVKIEKPPGTPFCRSAPKTVTIHSVPLEKEHEIQEKIMSSSYNDKGGIGKKQQQRRAPSGSPTVQAPSRRGSQSRSVSKGTTPGNPSFCRTFTSVPVHQMSATYTRLTSTTFGASARPTLSKAARPTTVKGPLPHVEREKTSSSGTQPRTGNATSRLARGLGLKSNSVNCTTVPPRPSTAIPTTSSSSSTAMCGSSINGGSRLGATTNGPKVPVQSVRIPSYSEIQSKKHETEGSAEMMVVFCTQCGKRYLQDAKFCAFCGHRRED